MLLPPAHSCLLAQDVGTGEKLDRLGSESEGMGDRQRTVLDRTCHQFLLMKVILRHLNRDLNSGDADFAVLGFVGIDLKASCPFYNPRVSHFKFVTR